MAGSHARSPQGSAEHGAVAGAARAPGEPRTCRRVSAGVAAGAPWKLRVAKAAAAFPPGSPPGAPGLQRQERPPPEVPRPAPGGTGCRRSAGRRHRPRDLPRDARPHGCGAAPGGCGRPLIPCPILECYSLTDNRVTRAAADVPNASIGHRNKEGRVPGSGLYNPELRGALIGSGGSRAGGERGRGSCAATRNPIAVLSWAPCGGWSACPRD